MLWFVSPFSKQVEKETSVGKKFFAALDSCFPKHHPLYKIINRNTIKQSYRTMPNFGKILKGLNKGIIKDYMEQQKKEIDMKTRTSKKSKGRPKYLVKKECNCDKTHPCPLENN